MVEESQEKPSSEPTWRCCAACVKAGAIQCAVSCSYSVACVKAGAIQCAVSCSKMQLQCGLCESWCNSVRSKLQLQCGMCENWCNSVRSKLQLQCGMCENWCNSVRSKLQLVWSVSLCSLRRKAKTKSTFFPIQVTLLCNTKFTLISGFTDEYS